MELLVCMYPPLDPGMKATLLANQISQLLDVAALPLVALIVVPLGVGGYFLVRRLRARRKNRSPADQR